MTYRDLVTIQQDNSKPSDNDPDYTGLPFADSIPCNVQSTTGNEAFAGKQIDPTIDYLIELHHIAGIEPDMRCRIDLGIYSGRIANIDFVQIVPFADGKPPRTILHCTELVNV